MTALFGEGTVLRFTTWLEIQFNVIDPETLLAAQESPDEYRDLIVRVSGFSAYFVDLDKACQDEIIARTDHALV